MILFFDTETTGVPRNYKAPVTLLDNWPRMVQLAWLLTEPDGTEIASAEYIIKPDGFTIPSQATRVHGITTARALAEGHELDLVLQLILADIQRASRLIAHNMAFDEKILGAEYLRRKRENPLPLKPGTCTMQAATDFCRLPGRYGYKWPTLDELHRVLFKTSFEGAHSALADVRACARCFFELREKGVLT